MAAGDAYVVVPTSLASNGFLDLQPAGATEISIHTIYYAGAMELYWYDGTNSIKFDSDGVAGCRRNLTHKCTNAVRIRVKNVSGGTAFFAADGMYTK